MNTTKPYTDDTIDDATKALEVDVARMVDWGRPMLVSKTPDEIASLAQSMKYEDLVQSADLGREQSGGSFNYIVNRLRYDLKHLDEVDAR